MSIILKVAAVQMNPKLMKKEQNLEKLVLRTQEAAARGARLIVFHECALTGYVFQSREEVLPFTEPIPRPATDKMSGICHELGVYVIFGLIENDRDKIYNAAILIGPEGLVGKYRKSYIPQILLDRLVEKGDKAPEVFRTPIGNIGVLICHDITFSESARILMLQGADVIALTTN
jgi:5-aminopentanamidase